ncbi:MAG: SHOCT domain-containing protein [Chordicoccus sp.]
MGNQTLSESKSFGNSLKEKMAVSKERRREVHVSLKLTAGKKELGLGMFSSSVVMRQKDSGYIYFDAMPGHLFEIENYSWNGPRYEAVTESDTTSNVRGGGRKHTGLGGALVGTMLMPGVGTAIGYKIGKNKVSGGGKKNTHSYSKNSEEEVSSPASLTLIDVTDGNRRITIGFECNSKLDIELQNFNMNSHEEEPSEADQIKAESDAIGLLKQYKELLDAGVITEEEFLAKKQQLLG